MGGTQRNGTEPNGMAKKQAKREEKRNGTEWDGTDNKTEWDRNGAVFLTPTVCQHMHLYSDTHLY